MAGEAGRGEGDKPGAEPGGNPIRILIDVGVTVEPLHVSDDDVISKFLLIPLPHARLKFAFPFFAKFDNFSRAQLALA